MIKMLTRSLSVLLVLVNLLSFIPTVAMASDTSTGSTDKEYGGVSGTASKGDSVTLNYAGGYRIYLTRCELIVDNLTKSGELHFNGEGGNRKFTFKSTDYLNRYKDYAIYEVTGVGGGKGDNEKYAIGINSGKALYSYNWTNTDKYYTSCTVLRDSVGNDKSNQSPDFKELVGEDKGSFIPWQSSDSRWADTFKRWANGVFNEEDFNFDKFLSNYKSILEKDKRQVPSWFPTTKSDYISGKFAIVVEPVVVVKLQGGIHYCFSAQDYFSEDKMSLWSTRNQQGTDTSISHNAGSGFCNSAKSLYNIFFKYKRSVTKDGNTTEVEIGTKDTKEAGYGIYKSADQITPNEGSIFTGIVVNAGTVKDTDGKPYAVGEAGTFTENNTNYDASSCIYRSTFLSDTKSGEGKNSVSSMQTLLESWKPSEDSTTVSLPNIDFKFKVSAFGNTQATYNYLVGKTGYAKEDLLKDNISLNDNYGMKMYPGIEGVRDYISSVRERSISYISTFVKSLTMEDEDTILKSDNTKIVGYQLFTLNTRSQDVNKTYLSSLVEAHATVKFNKSLVSGGLLNFGGTYSPTLTDATDEPYADANSGGTSEESFRMAELDEKIADSGYSPFAKLAARTVLTPEYVASVRKILDAIDSSSLSLDEWKKFQDIVVDYCRGVRDSADTDAWNALKNIQNTRSIPRQLVNSLAEVKILSGESVTTLATEVFENMCIGVIEASVKLLEVANADAYAVSSVNGITQEVKISSADYAVIKEATGISTDTEATKYILSSLIRSANGTSSVTVDGSTSAGTSKNSVGIAVALTAQTTPITSKSVIYTITDSNETWSSVTPYNYNSEESANIPLPDTKDTPNSYVVVIPRGTKLTLDNIEGFKSRLSTDFKSVTSGTVADVPSELKTKLGDNVVVHLLGDIVTEGGGAVTEGDERPSKDLTIKVGSVGSDEGLVGYDVVYILDKRTGGKNVQSIMSVRDYELNYVYKNLLGETPGTLISASATRFADTSATYTDSNNSEVNVFGKHIETGNSFGHTYANVYSCHSDLLANAYQVLKIKNGEGYGGTVLNKEKDNDSNFKNVLYNMTTGVFGYEASNPKEIASDNSEKVVLNHAVNLRRADFDDSLKLSSFFDANYASAIVQGNDNTQVGTNESADANLGSRIGLGYAKKPDARKTGAGNVDDSSNILAGGSDKFIWTVTSNCVRLTAVTCSYSEVGSSGTVSETIYVPANVAAFTNGRNTASYDVSETCYKYLAVERGTSSVTNKLLSVGKADTRGTLDYTATNPSSFNADCLEYRSASAFSASNTVLNFYPEIAMTAYFVNDTNTLDSENDVAKISMYVLGELTRKVKPSGLNILTLNPTESGTTNKITGSVTSTSFATGVSADKLSSDNGNIPVASGGINVDVSAGLKDALKLDVSGFYLDVIDRDIDTDAIIKAGTSKCTSGSTFKAYNEIVSGDIDTDSLRKTWGNSYNANSAFVGWTSSVKDKLSVSIGLQTYSNGVMKKSVSAIESPELVITGGTTASVLASYPLMIANGELVTSKIEGVSTYYTEYTQKAANSYKALIKAIAMKYNSLTDVNAVTGAMYDEAEKVFKESGLYQSICNAIESSIDADNSSNRKIRKPDEVADKWYDEQVRTIVVREYGYSGDNALSINDVIANTKVPYSLVPQMNGSQTEDYSVGYRARWFLTMYLKEGVAGYENKSYFDPTSSSTRSGAESSGTILINSAPVCNADFMIGNAVTNGMIN